MVAEISDDSDEEEEDPNGIAEVPVDGARPKRPPRKEVLHGIKLASCEHHFCGVTPLAFVSGL